MNSLFNENCIETMQRFSEQAIDLVVTSPPYDDLRTYDGYSFDFENIAKNLYRILKIGGVIVWIVNDGVKNGSESGTSFKQALYFKELGLNLHDTMIFQKTSFTKPDKTRYWQTFEYMFIFSKGKPKTINLIEDRENKYKNDMKYASTREKDGKITRRKNHKLKEKGKRTNVWTYAVGWNNSYKEEYLKGHPAIFPLQLAIDHIQSWSNEGDIVYDPFAGSGTTCLAAKMFNRQYLGSEISSHYYSLAMQRIQENDGLFP